MLERILRFSIRHRYLVVLLTVGAALVGLASLQRLPIDAVPDITNNQVQINTELSSLPPEQMEKQVTLPLESALAGIPGLVSTRSLSRNGFSQITAVFRDNVDVYFARQQVTERLVEARLQLPEGAEPQLGPIATGLSEIYMYVLEYEPGSRASVYTTPAGEILDTELERLAYLRELQDWVVTPQLRGVEGIAGVDTIGGYEKQYLVQPDPQRLVAYRLTFDDLREALEKNNLAIGAKFIEEHGEQYNVRADGRIRVPAEIERIVVGSFDGTSVYVGDLATVGIGREIRTGAGTENGREVVIGTALMIIGGNSRTVATAVDRRVQDIRNTLPPGIMLRTVLDRSKLVDSTIETVRHNLIGGALLVIVILFLMLGNIRAAIITALAIPLSMLLGAIGMVQFGISGNLMSLGAIDFGLVVDGAVIIVENCLRVLAERQHALGRTLNLRERLQAVFDASKQVREPTAFGEAIIITVYLPILALGGVEGKLFHPMALTVIFVLIGAFILSLTFIPAMVAICVTGRVTERESIIMRGAKSVYTPFLNFAVRARWVVVGGAAALFLMAVGLFMTLGQEFVPRLDEGDLALQVVRIPSTGISMSTEMQKLVEKRIAQMPEVHLIFSKTGTAEAATDPMPPNISDAFVILKPRNEWPNPNETKDDLLVRMQEQLARLPGQRYIYTQPIEMRTNELIAGVRGDVVVKIFGEDLSELGTIANDISTVLESIPGASDVRVEQLEGLPFVDIDIDREALARYGINVADVQNVISAAIGGQEAGQLFQGDRRFDIVVRLSDELRDNIAELGQLPIPLPAHDHESIEEIRPAREGERYDPPRVVPLESVARIRITEGPNQVSRENSKRRSYAASNVRGRDLASFVEEARERVASDVTLPPGYFLEWGGQYENLVRARERLAMVVPICFFLIFILLFTTFNSVKYALMVFVSVPLALPGGVLSLWLRDMPFSISAAVGFIAVSGVAVLDGLVLINTMNQLRREGMDLEPAIRQGATMRLRPVLMTSLVAGLGFLPMALATGQGSEVQKPLATVVIGGIITSTFLTLVVIPGLYRIFHRPGSFQEKREEESF